MLQTGSQTASGRLCPAPHQPLPSSVCPATGGSEQADVGGAGAHTSEGWAGSRVPAVLKSPVGRAHLLPRGGASPGRPSVWVSLQLPSVGASTCRPPCGQQRGQHSFEKPTVGLCEGQPVAPPGVLGELAHALTPVQTGHSSGLVLAVARQFRPCLLSCSLHRDVALSVPYV